ncbi:MAG: SLC13/DASS family transporter [Saprospirales bacterium]|nr:SLC13/DASS family transporter [Saprospirales bacterium]
MKKTQVLSWLKPGIAILIPLFILLIPADRLLPGMSVIEHRVLALFVLAALFWILEPIPIFATSVLIIVLELVMVSDQGFILFRKSSGGEEWTNLLSYKEIMGTFASPIILLFLGGFFLAMAATKYRMDQSLAAVLLKPFGTRPKVLLLGLMGITALFSMFMSNTATTAMMLSILVPVLAVLDADDPGRVAFTLGIPFAANIGGIGTPIGTPPNAIALKYITGASSISFGKWMVFGVPYALILLLICWILLQYFFPFKTSSVPLHLKGRFLRTSKAYIVYVTFVLTLFLWLTDFWHGMNAYVVAMIPVAVFLSAGIISREDLKVDQLGCVVAGSGGIALGLALEKSGLVTRMVGEIPFAGQAAFLVLFLAAFIGLLMANFMSHTGTANLLLPIVAALGTAGLDLGPVGGVTGLILGVTFSISVGMSLPISSPPNALAHAAGGIETRHMAKAGVLVGIIGLIGAMLLVLLLKSFNFFQP